MSHITDTQDLRWFKASQSSGSGGCVEVARMTDGRVAVRDSKMNSGPHFAVAAQAFAALVKYAGDDTI